MKPMMISALLMALLTPAALLAAEQLPDSAPPDEQAPQTREKGPSQALDSGELESLYLASPVELDTTDEGKGLNALSEESRYLESEQQEMLERQRGNNIQIIRTPEEAPPPPPPTLMPVRDL